jgi:hypothetical protein
MHIKTALASGLKMENMCACYYDQMFLDVDLFCKPAGGCAALGMGADVMMVRGMERPFECPEVGG